MSKHQHGSHKKDLDSNYRDIMNEKEILFHEARIKAQEEYRKKLWVRVVKTTLMLIWIPSKMLRQLPPKASPKIHIAPGTNINKILKFIYSKKSYDRIFMQVIADMREEHAEALSNNNNIKAYWIVFREHGSILMTIGAHGGVSIVKKIVNLWKMSS